MQSIKVSVRAIPAQGHEVRRRAGRAWSKKPVIVEVVDHVTDPTTQITPAQYAQLQADPLIAVSAIGGDDPQLPDLKAKLAAAEAAIDKLKGEFAQAAEAAQEERRLHTQELEKASVRHRELEVEIERLREQIAQGRKATKQAEKPPVPTKPADKE